MRHAIRKHMRDFLAIIFLFVVAFGKTQRRLASSGAGRLQIMAQRRLMLKTGEAMARRLHASALLSDFQGLGKGVGRGRRRRLRTLAAHVWQTERSIVGARVSVGACLCL